MVPGDTMLARTFFGAPSIASDFMKGTSAAFTERYGMIGPAVASTSETVPMIVQVEPPLSFLAPLVRR